MRSQFQLMIDELVTAAFNYCKQALPNTVKAEDHTLLMTDALVRSDLKNFFNNWIVELESSKSIRASLIDYMVTVASHWQTYTSNPMSLETNDKILISEISDFLGSLNQLLEYDANTPKPGGCIFQEKNFDVYGLKSNAVFSKSERGKLCIKAFLDKFESLRTSPEAISGMLAVHLSLITIGQTEKAAVQANIKRLTEENTSQQATINRVSEVNGTLQDKTQVLQKEIDKLHEQIKDLQKEKTKLSRQLEVLQHKTTTSAKLFADEKAALTKAVEEQRREITSLKAKIPQTQPAPYNPPLYSKPNDPLTPTSFRPSQIGIYSPNSVPPGNYNPRNLHIPPEPGYGSDTDNEPERKGWFSGMLRGFDK